VEWLGMPHRSERLELEMKMMRAPANWRAEMTDEKLPKRFAAQIADLKLREINEQIMNDPNPFLPVIYSSTTLLLVALALAVTLI
jgi:hypothetical protein